MIEYCILSYAGHKLSDTPWNCIQNSDDIFMPNKNSLAVSFDLVQVMFKGKHLDYYDWFSSNLGEQLKHEALVRDYV
jgi:hypothetical protein